MRLTSQRIERKSPRFRIRAPRCVRPRGPRRHRKGANPHPLVAQIRVRAAFRAGGRIFDPLIGRKGQGPRWGQTFAFRFSTPRSTSGRGISIPRRFLHRFLYQVPPALMLRDAATRQRTAKWVTPLRRLRLMSPLSTPGEGGRDAALNRAECAAPAAPRPGEGRQFSIRSRFGGSTIGDRLARPGCRH